MARITDQEVIRHTLRAYMLAPTEQPVPFLAVIRLQRGATWHDRIMLGGLIIEAARPLSASTSEDGDVDYTLTNGDSRYSAPIGSIRLSEIEYVETV